MPLPRVTKNLLPSLRYNTTQDVHMRLKDTVVSYDGKPVFVRQVTVHEPSGDEKGLHLYLYELETGKEYLAHSSDELLDISSMVLGWVQPRNGYEIQFLARTTRSSQRQGVHLNSLAAFVPRQRLVGHGYPWKSLPDLEPLVAMFRGDVFSIQSKLKEVLKGESYGFAVNREWALVNTSRNAILNNKFLTVFHHTIPVGTYIVDEKKFLFRRGRLTKTRRMELQDIFNHPNNYGVRYAISEQA